MAIKSYFLSIFCMAIVSSTVYAMQQPPETHQERQRVAEALSDTNANEQLQIAEEYFKHSQYQSAIDCYESSFREGKGSDRDHVNYGECQLALGNFNAGWITRDKRLVVQQPLVKPWKGEDITNLKLVTISEGGIGDIFFFSRWLMALKQKGAQTVLVAPRFLTALLCQQKYIDHVVAKGDPLPEYDKDIYLMSLPRYVSARGFESTTLDSIPQNGPYITAPRDVTQKWRQILANDPNPIHVGICWQASPLPGGVTRKYERNIALSKLIAAIYAGRKDISVYSIQGPEHAPITETEFQQKKLAGTLGKLDENDVTDLAQTIKVVQEEGGAFIDPAALAPLLHRVFSVDTAMANLAAGTGAKTTILLPHEADWRWLTQEKYNTQSPWFPNNVTLRWQQNQGNWEQVLHDISQEVASL